MINRNAILTIILGKLIIPDLTGQSIAFSIIGNVLYHAPSTHVSTSGDSISLIQYINDSTALESKGFSHSTSKFNYTTNVGFNFGVKIHINLSERLSINSGIISEFISFNSKSSYLNSDFVAVSKDTIAFKWNIFGPNQNCTVYENKISDLGTIKEGINHYLINLMIPLEITYGVIPDRLYLDGGIYLQSPLYALSNSENISVDMRKENGITYCRYKIVKRQIDTRFSDSQLGLSGTIGYILNRNLRLNLSIYKTVSNIFSKSLNSYSGSGDDYLKPLRISAGFQYTFGRFIKANESSGN